MDNPYFGVTNAFDDNDHWIHKISYSAWMSGSEDLPFIFMTSRAIHGGPDPTSVTRIAPAEPVAGVVGLRVQFQRQPTGGSTVHEIRVMGTPPRDAEYEVRIPRVVASARNARLAAKVLLEEWKQSLFEGLTPEADERSESGWRSRAAAPP